MSEQAALWIWGFGLLAWYLIRLPHQRRARKTRTVRDARSLEERVLLALAGVGLSIVPLIYIATGFPAFADYAFRPWLAWIGLTVDLASLFLFYASHRQLGRNWSVSLEIRDKHQLVTDGLYRYVRHPMYSSFWLWAVAQALLIPNWIAGFAGLAGVGILYFGRVGKEEAMMRASFGEEYDAYCSRTGRVVPRFS